MMDPPPTYDGDGEPVTDAEPASDGLGAPWRGSALRELAGSLPTVAHVLEDFIARANQTELAVATWVTAPERLDEEDARALAAEAELRVAEAELRDAAARAEAMQLALDDLQAQLTAAEARAAVAATSVIDLPRPLPWAAIVGAFVGGLVVMFAVSRLTDRERVPDVASEAAATPEPVGELRALHPTPPIIASPAPRPIITPAPELTVTPIEGGDPAAPEAPPVAPPAPPPAPARPAAGARPAARPSTTAGQPAAAPRKPPPAPAPAGTIADPFSGSADPAPPATQPAEPKPSGTLVNPF